MTEKTALDLVREVKDSLRYAEYREEIDKLAEAERLIVAMKSDFDFLRAESKTIGAEAVRKAMLDLGRLRAAVGEVERDIRAHNWNLDRLISWAAALRKALDA